MNSAKVSGFVGLVTTFGLAALVGCGGSDASPSLVLTDANAKTVASESLIDGESVSGFNASGDLSAFAPTAVHGLRLALARVTDRVGAAPTANATTTVPCDGGGTMTTDASDPPAPGAITVSAKETVTYAACVQGDSTLDGTVQVNGSGSATSISLTATVSLTIKSAVGTITESGGVNISLDLSNLGTSHITANKLTVAIASPAFTDSVTISNLDATTTTDTATGDASATESYDIATTQLGGLVSVATETAVATSATSQHPHAGQITITGAKSSKLVITILGDESFSPPAGQGQVKLELDAGTGGALGAPVFMSWADLEAAAGGGANIPL